HIPRSRPIRSCLDHRHMISMNNQMSQLATPLLDLLGASADDGELADPLASILAQGLTESNGCVLLSSEAHNLGHTSVELLADRTGLEAFINHIHVEDKLRLPSDDPAVLEQTLRYAGQLAGPLEATYPNDPFTILISTPDSC